MCMLPAVQRKNAYIGDLDVSQLTFMPMTTENGRSRVVIEDNARYRKQFSYQLCPTVQAPMTAKYSLDRVQEDGNPDRRGLTLRVTDAQTIASLKALDDAIVEEAIKRSKEWFKGKELNRDAVLARYKPILNEMEDHHTMKIKVKVGESKVKTALHLQEGDTFRKYGATPEQLKAGSDIVPVVSGYALWFMGGGSSFGLSLQAEAIIVSPAEDRDELDEFISTVPLKVQKVQKEDDDLPDFLRADENVEVALEGDVN